MDESVLDPLLHSPDDVEQVDVVLAIRSQLVRYGIEGMLRAVDLVSDLASYAEVDEAATVAASRAAGAGHGSVVLVVALSEVDAPAAPQLRYAAGHGVKILVIVDDVDRGKLSRMAEASGSGFVFADEVGSPVLRSTLQRMHRGEMPMPTRLTRQLLSAAGDGRAAATSAAHVRMTPRERHVLSLLVEGLSNKQIARRLGISEHGAKRHVANILAKLNCPNRTLVVAKALREGLCNPPH
jgi:DNA-binding NarL/FixJ family response regulator